MDLNQIRVVEIAHVGVGRLLDAPTDRVPLARIVDAVGETPLRQQMFALDPPDWLRLVQIEFAAAHHVVAVLAQQAVVGRLLDWVMDAVVGDAGAVVLLA